MNSKTDKTNPGWWNQEWCPLFGALPSCALRDGVSEECLSIIKDARYILDINRSVSGLINPDPKKIEKETGYPASLIDGARFLVHCCSAHDILFDAQYHQGLYNLGTGWAAGNGADSYLLIDVDQLDIAILNEAIRIRAGLPHKFSCALTDNLDDLTEEDWKHPIITPVMTFVMMSIAVAWDTFKHVSDGSMKPKSRSAVNELLTAQKLLKVAQRLRADASQQLIHQIKKKPAVDGHAGGVKGGKTRGDKAEPRQADWQKRADAIWKKPASSKWTVYRTAGKIAEDTGDKIDTIRKVIKKKLSSNPL
jgi:hypothetical protein